MANNIFLNETVYANTMLLLLKNQLVMGRLVDGQFKNKVTDQNGLSINIKRPPQFVAQDGEALALQSVVTGSVNVAVTQYKNVHIDIGDLEYVQSFNQLMMDSSMKSAASELAHTVDSYLLDKTVEFPSSVGVPGNVIGSSLQFNAAHTRLMDQSVPNESLSSVVSFADGASIRGQLTGTNIQGINRTALARVNIPIISEVDLYASNNLQNITAGTRAAAAGTVTGAGQNVNYRTVKDSMSQTLNATIGIGLTVKRGDIFTIAGVFAVNNRSRQVLPYLKQFVVLADATADGAGLIALSIADPIIVGGTSDGVGPTPTLVNTAHQTASAIPANGAAIVFYTAPGLTTPVRTAFHKSSIALVSARLRQPFTGRSSFASDPETGIGVRYWRGSSIDTGRHIHRWDMIFGAENVDRRLGTRVNGT